MISIIMSTYREKTEYIRLSIESMLNQTYRDIELILVPDDPDNNSVTEVLKEYQARDTRIRILENKKNLGLPGALNKALKEARGEYIARMDADDISHPERLEAQLQFLQDHDLDLVGTRKQCINENGERISGSETPFYSPDTVMRRLRWHDCLPHSTWLAKREVYHRLGGYRDMPRSEDFDFLLRSLEQGMKMGMCDQILFDHRINDAGISRSGMLEQLLASWYLTDHFGQLEQIAPQEVRDHIRLKMTPERAARYCKATDSFDQAVRCRKTNPIGSGVCLLKSLVLSPYYWRRMWTIFCLKLADQYKKA